MSMIWRSPVLLKVFLPGKSVAGGPGFFHETKIMTIVEAHVFYWTEHGMSTTQQSPHAVGYVQVSEVARMLCRLFVMRATTCHERA